MNERIRELAEQAVDFADNNYRKIPNIINGEEWSPCKRDNWRDLMQEKFAELIVRECVSVMYDNAIEREVPPDIDKTPTHYAVAVLKHFGVEE